VFFQSFRFQACSLIHLQSTWSCLFVSIRPFFFSYFIRVPDNIQWMVAESPWQRTLQFKFIFYIVFTSAFHFQVNKNQWLPLSGIIETVIDFPVSATWYAQFYSKSLLRTFHLRPRCFPVLMMGKCCNIKRYWLQYTLFSDWRYLFIQSKNLVQNMLRKYICFNFLK
jgi:hypothetical protein